VNDCGDTGYDCARARDELDAFVRGELPVEAAARMQEHLDHCRGCRDVTRFEQAFRARLRQAGQRECCPDHLRKRIEALLARGPADA
jgi:anti-sigma factor (TIGR02949 family)